MIVSRIAKKRFDGSVFVKKSAKLSAVAMNVGYFDTPDLANVEMSAINMFGTRMMFQIIRKIPSSFVIASEGYGEVVT